MFLRIAFEFSHFPLPLFILDLDLINRVCVRVCVCVCVCLHLHACLVIQPQLTLCISMDCSPPGSSVHEDHLDKLLEWVAMPSSRGNS